MYLHTWTHGIHRITCHFFCKAPTFSVLNTQHLSCASTMLTGACVPASLAGSAKAAKLASASRSQALCHVYIVGNCLLFQIGMAMLLSSLRRDFCSVFNVKRVESIRNQHGCHGIICRFPTSITSDHPKQDSDPI